jgi:putative ABC transport system permease protein
VRTVVLKPKPGNVMIANFLHVALRHLLRNQVYAGLNILGLSIGLACFAIIGMWMKLQLSYDRMHPYAERIHQINTEVNDHLAQYKQASTPAPLALTLATEIPEIESTVRIDVNEAVVAHDGKQFVEEGILAVDPSFFDCFNFKLYKGNKATALSQPYSVVISERIAKKYFGDRDPINSSLSIFQYDPDGKGAEYKITGVIEDCPSESHFNYAMLVSFKTVESARPLLVTDAGWSSLKYYTYVMLRPGNDASTVEAKLPGVLKKYASQHNPDHAVRYSYYLNPLTKIHFSSDVRNKIKPGTDINTLFMFGAVGMIVLVLACVNYVSLFTAYSIDKSTEVGVRKVLGASQRQVIIQYLAESWLLAIMAMLVSLVWIELSKPVFENIFDTILPTLYNPSSFLQLFFLASLTGIVSGIYPSLMLSSRRTINVLKGRVDKGSSAAVLRKSLVVIQYTVTIVLIIGILVTHEQVRYIENKDLGFQKKDLLILATNGSPEVIPAYQNFANSLSSFPGIAGITRSNTGIGGGGIDRLQGEAETSQGTRTSINFYSIGVDHDYLKTYEINLTAGRNFTPGNAFDSAGGFIINEAAAVSLGFQNPAEAVGRFFSLDGRKGNVIGVVKDFHYSTLREKIEPAALFLLNRNFSRITVKMTGDTEKNLSAINQTWKKHFPSTVADFSFEEDRLEKSYRAEDRFSKIFFVFSIISIVIASLGIFALVSYNVERRTKEIGIRKVLGGTTTQITTLLSKQFLLLTMIASGIALPIGWYITHQWLQNFAYHITPGAGIFTMAVAASILLAMITVGLKTVRAALQNPVDSLRRE